MMPKKVKNKNKSQTPLQKIYPPTTSKAWVPGQQSTNKAVKCFHKKLYLRGCRVPGCASVYVSATIRNFYVNQFIKRFFHFSSTYCIILKTFPFLIPFIPFIYISR